MGETLIDEDPLVIGPKQATHPVCLACYRRVDGSYLCTKCGWPMCDENCEISDHHADECELFVNNGLKITVPMDEDCRIYDCIAPLRCLLFVRQEDRRQLLVGLEAHQSNRKSNGLWDVDRITVVNVIRHQWHLAHLYEDDEIQEMCGILEVNAFAVEAEIQGVDARAIYSTACLMAHDCLPNTTCIINDCHRMSVKASMPIGKGSLITTSYTFTLDSTQRRRKHLKETKFFDCLCRRCRDPTELGTHLSSLVCQKCFRSFVVPEDPIKSDSHWVCLDGCGLVVDADFIEQLLDGLQRQADCLNYDDFSGLEAFTDCWSHLLHPNNSILIAVKYYLCQFYGNSAGFFLSELSAPLLRRKIQLCRELLKLAAVLEPGASNLRGLYLLCIVLYVNSIHRDLFLSCQSAVLNRKSA